MKFFHTADGQLGMKAAQVGVAGERVRAERHKTAERIVRLARDQAVDFIRLAGDAQSFSPAGPNWKRTPGPEQGLIKKLMIVANVTFATIY